VLARGICPFGAISRRHRPTTVLVGAVAGKKFDGPVEPVADWAPDHDALNWPIS
jgi:hypothetical protein